MRDDGDRTLVALGNEHALQVLQMGRKMYLDLHKGFPKIHEMKLRKLSQAHNRDDCLPYVIITDRQAPGFVLLSRLWITEI